MLDRPMNDSFSEIDLRWIELAAWLVMTEDGQDTLEKAYNTGLEPLDETCILESNGLSVNDSTLSRLRAEIAGLIMPVGPDDRWIEP